MADVSFQRYCVVANTGATTYTKTMKAAIAWADTQPQCLWFKVYLARGKWPQVSQRLKQEAGAWKPVRFPPNTLPDAPTAARRQQLRTDARRPDPAWLTVKEWATLNHLKYSTVQSWCFNGVLKYEFHGNKRFIHRDELPDVAKQYHPGQPQMRTKQRIEQWEQAQRRGAL